MTNKVDTTEIAGRIAGLLPRVSKPARYTGGELNSCMKDPGKADVRIALAFPDIYEIGMSNLGIRILYHILNGEDDIYCERVFAPAGDMEELMRAEDVPLFTLETATEVAKLDILAFSLAYELSYTTMLNMLDLAGIPVRSSDRNEDCPIVIAGGHCVFNPGPVGPFVDAFAVGDGEEVVLDIARAVRGDGTREEKLERLSKIDGVYVPGLYGEDGKTRKIRARAVRDLDAAGFCEDMVVPFIDIVHDRAMVEVMRGCLRGCRFCQAGMITRPLRERSYTKLLSQARSLLGRTGYDEIALTSLSSADYSNIEPLVSTLIKEHRNERIGVSLPSLRADASCVRLADEIQKVRKSGLTFAPEAGTQRLRDVINKNISEEDLVSAVDAAVKCGWKRVKLYFMIGLPTETDEDIVGIAELVYRVLDSARDNGVRLDMNVTVSPFVPKPHTPFQWLAFDSRDELERKIALLRGNLKAKNVSISWHDVRTSEVEALLARGDSQLACAVEKAWKQGACFEQDRLDERIWQNALAECGLTLDEYARKEYSTNDELPWDHIECGVSKNFLAKELQRAIDGVVTQDCRSGGCTNCGVKEFFALEDGCFAIDSKYEQTATAKQEEVPEHDKTNSYVLIYEKNEDARWLGHLDIVRVFERALRAAKVGVCYSQGFNPRPKMSFSFALPLGATASEEYVIVQLMQSPVAEELADSLNEKLPSGIRIKEAELMGPGVKGLEAVASVFTIEVACDGSVTSEMLLSGIDHVMASQDITVVRQSDKKSKTVDIRPQIKSLSLESISAGIAVIMAELLHEKTTPKPLEIVDVVFGDIKEREIRRIHRDKMVFRPKV